MSKSHQPRFACSVVVYRYYTTTKFVVVSVAPAGVVVAGLASSTSVVVVVVVVVVGRIVCEVRAAAAGRRWRACRSVTAMLPSLAVR